MGEEMKVLAIANQKGGVAKSTLTHHLVWAARTARKRVLFVELDSRKISDIAFPPSTNGIVASEIFAGAVPTFDDLEHFEDGLSIIRADSLKLVRESDRADYSTIPNLRKALVALAPHFDLCFIDTPPTLSLRLDAALVAADFVVTPINIGAFEIAGMGDLLETIQTVQTGDLNPDLQHIGIVAVNFNTRSADEMGALAQMHKMYGKAFLSKALLPARASVNRASAMGVPVWKSARGESHREAAKEWRNACAEILKRIK